MWHCFTPSTTTWFHKHHTSPIACVCRYVLMHVCINKLFVQWERVMCTTMPAVPKHYIQLAACMNCIAWCRQAPCSMFADRHHAPCSQTGTILFDTWKHMHTCMQHKCTHRSHFIHVVRMHAHIPAGVHMHKHVCTCRWSAHGPQLMTLRENSHGLYACVHVHL